MYSYSSRKLLKSWVTKQYNGYLNLQISTLQLLARKRIKQGWRDTEQENVQERQERKMVAISG